jgi:hypothetical protein
MMANRSAHVLIRSNVGITTSMHRPGGLMRDGPAADKSARAPTAKLFALAFAKKQPRFTP